MSLSRRIARFQRAWARRGDLRRAAAATLDLPEDSLEGSLGTLTSADEARLTALVRRAERHPGPIVEIGTLFGLTTRLIVAAAPPGRLVITVDNFSWNPLVLPRAHHELLVRRVLRPEIDEGRIQLEIADSAVFRGRYGGPTPALVFLDADHAYEPVRDEIRWAQAIGVPIICGHDYGQPRFGVTRAVDEACATGLEVHGTVWSWEREP